VNSADKIRYIDSIFERDKERKYYTEDALLLQDLLRYSFIINGVSLEKANQFRLRQLQNWIVRNNKQIVDYWNENLRRRNTTYSNRVHAMEGKINNRFEILLELNLVSISGDVQAEKIRDLQVPLHEYTKPGILLALIIKTLNLKEVITITTKKDKIVEQRKELDRVYQDIYRVLDLAFKIKKDSSSAVIFYSTLFQNCKNKGIFDKLVERIHYITNSNSNIINATDLLQRAVYHAFFDKHPDTRFLEALYETLDGLDHEIKKLILYRLKIFAENRFENMQEEISRQYEEFRFEMKSDYDQIAIQGYCENCKRKQDRSLHYSELTKFSQTDNADIRVDCRACNTKDSLLISNFYS
jgi:hypothetical protein